jgi:hypothetical protein
MRWVHRILKDMLPNPQELPDKEGRRQNDRSLENFKTVE